MEQQIGKWFIALSMTACFATLTCAANPAQASAELSTVPAGAPLRAAITVDAGKELCPVNTLVFGNNQLGTQACGWKSWRSPETYTRPGECDCGSGIWDPVAKRPVPEIVTLAREAGITVARYPGGCYSHNFNWKSCIGPVEKRPNQKFGLPEFLMFCEKTGGTPVITVAEYCGVAQDAADLVEYCNAPDDGKHPYAAMRAMDGHPSPYGVVWFEYGNESYHGNHGGAEFPGKFKIYTPEEYGRNYLVYRRAMKAVDNKIRLGVVLDSVGSEWDEKVLKTGGRNIDFVIPHIYTPSYSSNDGKPDAKTLFTIGLAAPNHIPVLIKRWKEQIKLHTGIDNMPFAITEFNGAFVQDKPVPYRLCLGNALIVAEHLRFYMHEPSIAIASYWQFANEYWGMVKGYKEPYTKRPAYWLFWLYKHYFGDVLIDAAVDCSLYDSPGGYKAGPAYGKPTCHSVFPENILPSQKWNIQNELWFSQQEENGVLVATINSNKTENYFHAEKRLPATPLTGYLVSAEIKVEGLASSTPALTTGGWNGAGIQIGDARGWNATRSSSLSNMARSNDWTKVQAEYVTLPDTKDIVVQARCLDTRGVPGKIYVRNVQIRRFIPDNSGAVPYLGVNASKSKDGKLIYIMIVNKHLTDDIQTDINGVSAKAVEAYCLSGPSIDALNEQNPDNVKVNGIPANINKESVEIALPKHSMTAVIIRL